MLDRAFHFIMKGMVPMGQAPHYPEIAREWVEGLIEMGKIGPFWKKPKAG